jgi:hypothetical protein
MSLELDFALGVAVLVAGSAVATVFALWLARKEGGGLPKNLLSLMWTEFCWIFWSDLRLFRDMFLSPILGMKLAFLREERRTRAHRRERQKQRKL